LGWQRNEALSVTWGEAEVFWHERHGALPDRYHCAGCQSLLLGQATMALSDGARVHWDDEHGLDCLILYGRRWRGAAAAGLAELGLTAPSEYKVDAAKLAAGTATQAQIATRESAVEDANDQAIPSTAERLVGSMLRPR
jgi:hypothetical protein